MRRLLLSAMLLLSLLSSASCIHAGAVIVDAAAAVGKGDDARSSVSLSSIGRAVMSGVQRGVSEVGKIKRKGRLAGEEEEAKGGEVPTVVADTLALPLPLPLCRGGTALCICICIWFA